MKIKRKIDFKQNLKTYLSFLKKYKARVILMLVIAFIIEAGVVFQRYLFKVVIDKGTSFTNNTLALSAYTNILLWLAGIFLISGFLNAFLRSNNLKRLIKLSTDTIADLKRRYFNHIVHLSHSFHTTHKTGSLISRILRGGHAIDGMNDVIIFNFAPLFFQLIIITGALLYFSVASAVVFILTATSFISYSIYIQEKAKLYREVLNRREDREKANISDIMTNIDSIKYFGKENFIKQRFKRLSEETRKAAKKSWDFFAILNLGQSIILTIGLILLIYFPIKGFLQGTLSIGSLVFIYSIYGNLIGVLFGFVHGIREYYRAMVDFNDLFQYGYLENDIKDSPDSKKLNIREGTIDFENIDFRYHKRKLFKNFNLEVKKNQKVALVGHSGCGKTTLIKLLYRLYDTEKGQILIDGKNIREFEQESLRGELSIVPQEAVLFDDTIYNNIAFSNSKATRRQVMSAMKFAQLDKIVKSFPNKEKTIVGERGVKLSGGEKQRVSIARAILADKKVLVLDEATSSLDSETEHEIQKDLQNLMQGRTSIIIAHRLSTIMHADKIIVMEKGKIVQAGTHRNLINRKGQYKKLWNLQKGGYIK